MKRIISNLTKTALVLSLLLTFGCSKGDSPDNSDATSNTSTTDKGVIINGVKWATRNIDAPGTFTTNPEEPGALYQWGSGTSQWTYNYYYYGGWKAIITPSGWRIPTQNELNALCDNSKVNRQWLIVNGMRCMKITDTASGNSMLLPASGDRAQFDGTFENSGTNGYFWSSTESSQGSAYFLGIQVSGGSDGLGMYSTSCKYGFSVRAVAE